MKLTAETVVLGEKPVPVPLRRPQIPHGLTQDRTRASAIRGPRLIAFLLPLLLLLPLLILSPGTAQETLLSQYSVGRPVRQSQPE